MSARSSVVDQTTRIVAAYVSNNSVSAADLPRIIGEAHAALAGLDQPTPASRKPAVSIKNSVTKNAIVCLEDGKSFHSLKRHLKSGHDLTPEQYRQKWGLPADYPMVAPAYSTRRSDLAKKMGLGRKPNARRGKIAR
jgi:predicted transcriptional regulator